MWRGGKRERLCRMGKGEMEKVQKPTTIARREKMEKNKSRKSWKKNRIALVLGISKPPPSPLLSLSLISHRFNFMPYIANRVNTKIGCMMLFDAFYFFVTCFADCVWSWMETKNEASMSETKKKEFFFPPGWDVIKYLNMINNSTNRSGSMDESNRLRDNMYAE